MKIATHEKTFIRAFVKYAEREYQRLDASVLESEVTKIMDKRNIDYRNSVEAFIQDILNNIPK